MTPDIDEDEASALRALTPYHKELVAVAKEYQAEQIMETRKESRITAMRASPVIIFAAFIGACIVILDAATRLGLISVGGAQ